MYMCIQIPIFLFYISNQFVIMSLQRVKQGTVDNISRITNNFKNIIVIWSNTRLSVQRNDKVKKLRTFMKLTELYH